MAEAHAATLVRVSIASGTRRVDLALPGAVPVAELVPELARSVGVLDAGTAHAGYALVGRDGRRLDPVLGLRAQGVADGALLTVVAGLEMPPPRPYDDRAEALSDALERETRRWRAGDARTVRASGGGVLLGLAAGLGMPAVRAGVALPLAGLLVAAVLGAGLLPQLALALTDAAARAGGGPGRGPGGGFDAAGAAADARLAHRILMGLGVTTGLLVVGAAPAVAQRGRWGIALAVLACLAVLLGVRHRRSYGQVLAGTVLGVGGLAGTAVTVLRLHPAWRVELAALLALTAVAALAASLLGEGRGSARLGWLGDLLETATLLALVPLLVLASGLLDRLPG